MLESRGGRLRPGDVMVLVRRRNDFARALVRALKSRGVPVAGLDRLVLTEQPAVQDLLALADALLLPQDDLTFACLLTSPLGGLTDDGLMELAVGRRGHAVGGAARRARTSGRTGGRRGSSSPRCWRGSITSSPHALFAEALGPLGGRARLYARLGPEAAEPVDELLNAALAYAPHASAVAAGLPALAAPLRRRGEARGGGRRQPGAHHDRARRQGIAGAAGDPARHHVAAAGRRRRSCGRRPRHRAAQCRCGRRAGSCAAPPHDALRDAGAAAADGGAQPAALRRADPRRGPAGGVRLADAARAATRACWYRLVERGFDAPAGASAARSTPGMATRRCATPRRSVRSPSWHRRRRARRRARSPLPRLGRRARRTGAPRRRPPSPARPEPLAPSRPEGVELGPVPAAASPLAARDAAGDGFRRGQLMHALLQHLPDLPAGRAAAAARAWLDRPATGWRAGEAERTGRARSLAILDHPDLAPLFGAGQPRRGAADRRGRRRGGRRAGRPAGGAAGPRAGGRLQDQPPPARPASRTRRCCICARWRPIARCCAAIFPGRAVVCALVWTQTAQVAMLPDDIAGPARCRAAGSPT